jgi:hypothetical protein
MAEDPKLVELHPGQRSLYESLKDIDARLGGMYLGAIAVLDDESNPDSLALAAHGLRELMEKIPRYRDLPLKAHSENLGSKVREIEEVWNTAVAKSGCHRDGYWSGEIDKRLRRMLKKLGEFFAWHETHRPRRNHETAGIIRDLEPSGQRFPPSIEEEHISSWSNIFDFFVAASHHKTADPAEFRANVQSLEDLLLDRLAPKTFADFDTIDEILREAKNDGQA